MAYFPAQSRSPELKHPVPTHPAYIPEPPATPNSPQGYQRFASSPPHAAPFAAPAQFVAPTYAAAPHPAFAQPGTGAGAGAGAGAIPGVPPPDFGAWGMNDATAQFGMQLGQSAVAAGQQYVQKNFGAVVPGVGALKHHFNVSNVYVVQKLQLVLFPWKHRAWTRKVLHADGTGPPTWVPPREDVNSPDLYIPTMALVTYILLAVLHGGLEKRFDPRVFAGSASKAIGMLAVDYCFTKGGCYILGVQGAMQSFDLVSYGGYKFVGVIVTVIAGLLGFGRLPYAGVFAYAFLANSFFLLRSLRQVVLADVNTTPTLNPQARKRRITFLFLVAVSQVVYMGVLVRV